MKLIKTESRYGTPNGYFDPTTGIYYKVDGEHPFWVVARLPTKAEISLTPTFVDYDDALAELDRIAALIGEAAPAHGWVKGAPPLDDKHYLARLRDESEFPFTVVTKSTRPDTAAYEATFGYHDTFEITHHQPTPIVIP